MKYEVRVSKDEKELHTMLGTMRDMILISDRSFGLGKYFLFDIERENDSILLRFNIASPKSRLIYERYVLDYRSLFIVDNFQGRCLALFDLGAYLEDNINIDRDKFKIYLNEYKLANMEVVDIFKKSYKGCEGSLLKALITPTSLINFNKFNNSAIVISQSLLRILKNLKSLAFDIIKSELDLPDNLPIFLNHLSYMRFANGYGLKELYSYFEPHDPINQHELQSIRELSIYRGYGQVFDSLMFFKDPELVDKLLMKLGLNNIKSRGHLNTTRCRRLMLSSERDILVETLSSQNHLEKIDLTISLQESCADIFNKRRKK